MPFRGLLCNLSSVDSHFELARLGFGGAFAAHAAVGLFYLAMHDRDPVT